MGKFPLIISALILFFASALMGQNLEIQGNAQDQGGASLKNGSYAFQFRLYHSLSGGEALWEESQKLQVIDGVFKAVLGKQASMEGVDFSQPLWLGIEIDRKGEISPRTKLNIATPQSITAKLTGVDNVFPSSGAVGIGTNKPAKDTALHIKDDTATMRIENASGTALDLTAQKSKVVIKADKNLAIKSNHNAGIFVKTNGNVGIGTEYPDHTLEVGKNSENNRLRINRSDNSYESFLEFSTGDTGKTVMGLDNYNNNFQIYTYGPGNTLTIDNETGDVGIANTAPKAKLDVKGDIDFDAFANEKMAPEGYVQMGNFIMQWGVYKSNSGENQSISFSTVFPNQCFGVFMNPKASNMTSPITVSTWSNSKFIVNRDKNIQGDITVNWFAFGF